ncbi:hypothetical protein PIROE2DRAFT_6693 [Piromyces sp. E2]|nr:hypothetical protein PIROE2DRAFT_6693 [Piromyces sp. E2]|eukprot:OUM66166.1 hypothetical protein PIROE2DRAFT_6693 [Piromyces sp. E2]
MSNISDEINVETPINFTNHLISQELSKYSDILTAFTQITDKTINDVNTFKEIINSYFFIDKEIENRCNEIDEKVFNEKNIIEYDFSFCTDKPCDLIKELQHLKNFNNHIDALLTRLTNKRYESKLNLTKISLENSLNNYKIFLEKCLKDICEYREYIIKLKNEFNDEKNNYCNDNNKIFDELYSDSRDLLKNFVNANGVNILKNLFNGNEKK